MLCQEGGVEIEKCHVDLMKGEHKTAEFIAINPMGLVPSIVEGDFMLSECGAILTYLCESRSLTTWLPEDPRVRARLPKCPHCFYLSY